MNSGTIQSNWIAKEEKNLKDCIQWCLGGQSSDVEDTVQVENCIMLEPKDDGSSGLFATPACQLLLNCPATLEMNNISILSEARIIEVYGHHGEYLKTCRSELVEEADDMAVFRTEIIFDRPVTVCSLKFTSLKSKRSMWLYGVRVILQTVVVPQISSRVPLHTVEQRLGSMAPKLSEKAEAFKQLVEGYQSAQSLNNSDLSSLALLFQKMNMFNPTMQTPSNNRDSHMGISMTMNSVPSSRSSDRESGRKQFREKSRSFCSEEREFDDNLSISNREKIPDANSNLAPDRTIENENLKNNINDMNTISDNVIGGNNVQDHVLRRNQENINLELLSQLEERLSKQIDEHFQELENKLWERMERRMKELEQKVVCKLDEILTLIKPQGVAR